MNALEFNNISLKIGKNTILDDVSFEVEKGSIFGLIGHNGAGKTSLIRILLGLTARYSGSIRIMDDSDLSKKRRAIGAVLDTMAPAKNLTAKQYIRRVGRMLNGSFDEEIDILEKTGLSETGNKRVLAFSLGMKRRLIMAGALVGEPEILVLDEPFNGIDPEGMSEMRLTLTRLASEGITVLVTSHNIPELLKFASAFGVMCKGKYAGTVTDKELSAMLRKKTVLKTNDPQRLVSEMKKKLPDYCPTASSSEEISIFEELDHARCDKIRETVSEGLIKDIQTAFMSEEEILLWKMNGHA